MISIALVGAHGRMGRAIEQAAAGMAGLVVAAWSDDGVAERLESAGAGRTHPGYTGGRAAGLVDVAKAGDVVIEFSTPAGLRETAGVCRELKLPLVSGTTGLGAADEALLDSLAAVVPVLRASNFSIGVAALRRALKTALASLPESWDIEIVERHHRAKADSPSGTALTLAADAVASRGWGDDALQHGRHGRVGPRPARQIGMHAIRGGTWVGDHSILLAGSGESLELRHVAEDRSAFALGALAAARFVATAKPGRYAIEDALPPAGRG